MAIESTPDAGVEMRNAEVALLDAPFFFKVAAVGITAQLQRGRGIPNKDDLTIPDSPLPPKDFLILSVEMKTCTRPEIKRPNIKKGAAESK